MVSLPKIIGTQRALRIGTPRIEDGSDVQARRACSLGAWVFGVFLQAGFKLIGSLDEACDCCVHTHTLIHTHIRYESDRYGQI